MVEPPPQPRIHATNGPVGLELTWTAATTEAEVRQVMDFTLSLWRERATQMGEWKEAVHG